MKQLIFVLSMLCMLGAGALGIMNKNDVERTIRELKDTQEEVRSVTQELGAREDKRDGLIDDESRARDVRNMASAAVDAVQQDLRIQQRKIDDQKETLEGIKIEEREIEMALRRVFPDGDIKTPEDLKMVLTMLQDRLTGNQTRINTLDMELAKLMAEKEVEVARVGEEENFQLDRARKIALGALEATVIAVNNDWGFVIVNAGRIHGVETDASLLVKRGNMMIGRLRILNLQDNVSVCDVVKGSTPRGLGINVGDRVIFQNPFN